MKLPLIRNRLVGDRVAKMFLFNKMSQAQISRETGISRRTVGRILKSRGILNTGANAPGLADFSLLEKVFMVHFPEKYWDREDANKCKEKS